MRGHARGVLTLLLLLVVPGCGGGGTSTNQTGQTVPNRLQLQLGNGAQRQLRATLHDRSVKVGGVNCEATSAGGVNACVLQVTDRGGHRGTVTLAVTIDPKSHSAQVQFVGSSNRRWSTALQR